MCSVFMTRLYDEPFANKITIEQEYVNYSLILITGF